MTLAFFRNFLPKEDIPFLLFFGAAFFLIGKHRW
jgi:hypothetical protein